jgi:hypothetical protein
MCNGLTMLNGWIRTGAPDCLARRGMQIGTELQKCPAREVADALNTLKLPLHLVELYSAQNSVDNEFYFAAVSFRSIGALLQSDVGRRICFAVRYHGIAPVEFWFDRVDFTVQSYLGGDVKAIMPVEYFMRQCRAQALHQDALDDISYRRKCVNGVYVPTPDFGLSESEDDIVD